MSGNRAPLRGFDSTELAAALFIAAANIVLNRAVPRRSEIPAGLCVAAAMLLLAVRSGANASDLGLAPTAFGRGVRTGLAFGVPIGTAMTAGAFLGQAGRFYSVERLASASAREALYQFALRIPIATAAAEELIFRSGFEAILARRRPARDATILASALFAAWHLLPTLDRMFSNPGVVEAHQGSIRKRSAILMANVAATFAGGVCLSLLRRRTGSVIAPIIVHASVNGGGFVGGWFRRAQ